MARQRKKKSDCPDGFPEKSWNKLSETWRSGAASKQTEDLEQDILKAVRSMANTNHDMKNDQKLEALVKECRERKSFYTDTIAIEKAKVDYCIYLMNDRGAPVSKDEEEDEAEEA
jgi:hypothetical protein